jgi:tetratricopeptide (TPR) repeat protein
VPIPILNAAQCCLSRFRAQLIPGLLCAAFICLTVAEGQAQATGDGQVRGDQDVQTLDAQTLALDTEVSTLFEQGLFKEALEPARRSLAIKEGYLPPDSDDIGTSLLSLTVIYRAKGELDTAAEYARRLVENAEVRLGRESEEYAFAINFLGLIHMDKGHYDQAEPLLTEALAISRAIPSTPDTSLAIIMNNVAIMKWRLGKFAEAESHYRQVIDILGRELEENDPRLILPLNNLASLLLEQYRFDEAEPLLKRALAIWDREPSARGANIAYALNNLGQVKFEQGHFEEAAAHYRRAVDVWTTYFGEDFPNLATAYINLGDIDKMQGRFQDAERLYTKAIRILESSLDKNHPKLATAIQHLGLLYQDFGRFAEAEDLLQRALEMQETSLGPNHRQVARGLTSLADLYQLRSRRDDAVALLDRAIGILESAYGEGHSSVGAARNQLGRLHLGRGDYERAEEELVRAERIFRAIPDQSDLYSALVFANLGNLKREQGQFEAAKEYFRMAIEIGTESLGENHPAIGVSLNNLALLYETTQQAEKAEDLFLQSIAIAETALGPDHPDVATSQYNLAHLYRNQGRLDEALAAARETVRIASLRRNAATNAVGAADDTEFRENQTRFRTFLDIAADIHASESGSEARLSAETFVIAQQARFGSVEKALQNAATRFAAKGVELAALVREHQDSLARRAVLEAHLVEALGSGRHAKISSLRQTIRALDREIATTEDKLASGYPNYAALADPRALTVQETQALLAPDEALLTFIVNRERSYLWLLRKDSFGYFVLEIGEQELGDRIAGLRELLIPGSDGTVRGFPARNAHILFDELLGRAWPMLDGVTHAIVAPDGPLLSLPFELLLTATPQRPRLHTPQDLRAAPWLVNSLATSVVPGVSSLRAMRVLSSEPGGDREPFVGFGNPDLDGGPGGRRGISMASLYRGTGGSEVDVTALRKLSPLPETAEELAAIAQSLNADHAAIRLGARATERNVKQSDLSKTKVIAFATHGVVGGEVEGAAGPGLVLTPPAIATPEDDGLLTAGEVTQLSLNADWVILSACNTAADDGTPGAEGLTGLAKAFLFAGARALLVSHWPVDSRATVALTTSLFRNQSNDPTLSRAAALRQARLSLLNDSSVGRFAHPFYWAPFVIVGDGSADQAIPETTQ